MNVDKLSRSFAVKSNDMMLVIYLSSMVRSVLAMHDLIDNREGEAECIDKTGPGSSMPSMVWCASC